MLAPSWLKQHDVDLICVGLRCRGGVQQRPSALWYTGRFDGARGAARRKAARGAARRSASGAALG